MVKVLNIIKVLIGFHAFSGCDQTGKFHGYRKKSFQQTPLRSPDVLDTFGRLGNDEPPIKTNLTKFEKFVLNLHCKNSVPSSVTTLADLRCQMFSKNQADSDSRPPTLAEGIISPYSGNPFSLPLLPDPNDYGCLLNKNDQVFDICNDIFSTSPRLNYSFDHM